MKSYNEMKEWIQELIVIGPKNVILTIVGNKIDLCDKEEVEYATVKEYAASIGAILKLISAK